MGDEKFYRTDSGASVASALVDGVATSLRQAGATTLEYRQLQAAVASRRPLFAATALERLVGRCWTELELAHRAYLLELAQALRQQPSGQMMNQLEGLLRRRLVFN